MVGKELSVRTQDGGGEAWQFLQNLVEKNPLLKDNLSGNVHRVGGVDRFESFVQAQRAWHATFSSTLGGSLMKRRWELLTQDKFEKSEEAPGTFGWLGESLHMRFTIDNPNGGEKMEEELVISGHGNPRYLFPKSMIDERRSLAAYKIQEDCELTLINGRGTVLYKNLGVRFSLPYVEDRNYIPKSSLDGVLVPMREVIEPLRRVVPVSMVESGGEFNQGGVLNPKYLRPNDIQRMNPNFYPKAVVLDGKKFERKEFDGGVGRVMVSGFVNVEMRRWIYEKTTKTFLEGMENLQKRVIGYNNYMLNKLGGESRGIFDDPMAKEFLSRGKLFFGLILGSAIFSMYDFYEREFGRVGVRPGRQIVSLR